MSAFPVVQLPSNGLVKYVYHRRDTSLDSVPLSYDHTAISGDCTVSEKSASSGKTGHYDASNTPAVLVHTTNPELVPASRWKDHFKDKCKGEHSAAKRLRARYRIVL